jgi:hypothetical protein
VSCANGRGQFCATIVRSSSFELRRAKVCALSWRRIINGAHSLGAQIAFISVQRISVLLNPHAGTLDDGA